MDYNINYIFSNDNEKEYSNIADFCNKNGYVINEIEPDENKRRFQIIQPTISLEESKQNRVAELQTLLHKTDWIVTKLAEMQLTNNKNFVPELARYQDIIQNRVAWRTEIDRLLNK